MPYRDSGTEREECLHSAATVSKGVWVAQTQRWTAIATHSLHAHQPLISHLIIRVQTREYCFS